MWSNILRSPLLIQSICILGVVIAVPKCTPGTTWKEDCNSCFCTPDGFAGCTLMACVPKVPKLELQQQLLDSQRDKRDGVPKCTPGTTWKEDCNSCVCTPDGFAGCTEMACVPKLEHEQQQLFDTQRDKRDGARCIPGSTFMEDCNSCRCSADGLIAACTRKICIPPDQRRLNYQRKKRYYEASRSNCEPGTNWREDCNSCICNSNGVARCTQMRCPSYMQEFGFRVKRNSNDPHSTRRHRKRLVNEFKTIEKNSRNNTEIYRKKQGRRHGRKRTGGKRSSQAKHRS